MHSSIRSNPAVIRGCRLRVAIYRSTVCRSKPATASHTARSLLFICEARVKSFFLTLHKDWFNLSNLMSTVAAVHEGVNEFISPRSGVRAVAQGARPGVGFPGEAIRGAAADTYLPPLLR